jgi:hypothetical protein
VIDLSERAADHGLVRRDEQLGALFAVQIAVEPVQLATERVREGRLSLGELFTRFSEALSQDLARASVFAHRPTGRR